MAGKDNTYDLVVIGTGWFGLAAAKTYRELHGGARILLLDKNATIGGVWAEERLYPGLRTNNMLGTSEFPGFPMDTATFGVKQGQHIPGDVMHKYMEAYAERFGLNQSLECGADVISATHHDEGGWTILYGMRLDASLDGEAPKRSVLAKKLVVATGLTSEPFLPDLAGQETFNAPVFHGKDLASHTHLLKAKQVTVYGGTKTAWDAVYAYATAGVKVDWVIRESGHGPAWMAPPYVTPLKKWLEKLVMTRLLTWMSPCIWADADGYSWPRWFLHRTIIGRAIVNAFWWILANDVLTLNKYDAHPETKKLKPWSNPMFVASSVSILNYPTDFFELVRNGAVRVHIADIERLSDHAVHLSDGQTLQTEALCCITGWKHVPPLQFLPKGIEVDLGLPHDPEAMPVIQGEQPLWTIKDVARADAEILRRFPRLRQQPAQPKHYKPLLETRGTSTKEAINPSTELTPYTLYRFMVPPSPRLLVTHDIAFAGMALNFGTSIMASLQALWIAAYFDGQLGSDVVPTNPVTNDKGVERLRRETLLHARFGRWRYPSGYGARFPDFVFDFVPYMDLLLGDLGLQRYRKKGWLAEVLEPYGPDDYKDLVQEWKGTQL